MLPSTVTFHGYLHGYLSDDAERAGVQPARSLRLGLGGPSRRAHLCLDPGGEVAFAVKDALPDLHEGWPEITATPLAQRERRNLEHPRRRRLVVKALSCDFRADCHGWFLC